MVSRWPIVWTIFRVVTAPASIARSIGLGVSAYAELFAGWRPDLLLVTADRFDMFPAALAAVPYQIPLAHLHGGEVTAGVIDDDLRHALTKLCHIHLVAAEEYARRVRQMGEAPDRVHVVGAPGLDDVVGFEPLDPSTLKAEYGFVSGACNLLVVYHPATRNYADVGREVGELLRALGSLDANLLILRPNADTGHGDISRSVDEFCTGRTRARAVTDLPRRTFLSLMRAATVMVGNSSAGIWEAPSLGVPVVNVGNRQQGRLRAANVIDCAADSDAIASAIRRAQEPEFVRSLKGMDNPYGDGESAARGGGSAGHLSASGPDVVVKGFADM